MQELGFEWCKICLWQCIPDIPSKNHLWPLIVDGNKKVLFRYPVKSVDGLDEKCVTIFVKPDKQM
jgi:hypothetical protein